MADTLGEKAYLQSNENSKTLAGLAAQVKKIVVLTQAEYDALPASKLTDNALYLIKG